MQANFCCNTKSKTIMQQEQIKMALQKKKKKNLIKTHRPFGSPEWRRWIAQVIECMQTGDYSRFGGEIELSVNDFIFILNYKDGRLSLNDVERLEKE